MNKWHVVLACVAFGASSPSLGQEMKAERMTNVAFHEVEFIKFKPGKRTRAMEIVRDFFTAADKDVGGAVIDLHMDTGAWDAIVVFPMSGGPGDLAWETSPDEVKWMAALNKRAGGADKAKALLDEWSTLVDRREVAVAHRHTN